ncbi:MAG: hypothetical protein ACRD2S_03265, partial [Terriglobales bacterium]
LVVGARSSAQTDSSGGQPAPNGPVNTTSEPPQTNDTNGASDTTDATQNNSESMVTPSVVGGTGSSLAFTSEMERSNYLRGGASVTAAYMDNVLSRIGNVGSDISYTIGPFVSLDLSRPRYRLDFSYSPGFTFYQRHSSLDQTSESVAFNFAYRLSPHVTFTAQDSLAKTSGFFGPVAFNGVDTLPNPLQSANLTLIAPIADTLINTATVGVSYQFGLNDMVGVTGNSSVLRYLNRNESPGLFDSTGEGAGAYYSHRFANRNYIAVNYQFETFLSDTASLLPGTSQIETRTHSIYGSYTLYLKRTLSITAFGGPQYSDTFGGTIVPQQMWSPSGGGSLSWQGKETSFAASYSRRITDGGGLPGAVLANIADASFRAQLTKNLTTAVSADYATNTVLDSAFVGGFGGGLNGHSVSESVSLARTFGEHVNASAGYTHLHQSYANISTFDIAPNVNSVFVSVSYHFERPLGR